MSDHKPEIVLHPTDGPVLKLLSNDLSQEKEVAMDNNGYLLFGNSYPKIKLLSPDGNSNTSLEINNNGDIYLGNTYLNNNGIILYHYDTNTYITDDTNGPAFSLNKYLELGTYEITISSNWAVDHTSASFNGSFLQDDNIIWTHIEKNANLNNILDSSEEKLSTFTRQFAININTANTYNFKYMFNSNKKNKLATVSQIYFKIMRLP